MSCWLRKIPLWAPERMRLEKASHSLVLWKTILIWALPQKRAPPPEYLVHTLSIAASVWLPYHVWGVWTLRIRQRPGSDPSCSLPPPLALSWPLSDGSYEACLHARGFAPERSISCCRRHDFLLFWGMTFFSPKLIPSSANQMCLFWRYGNQWKEKFKVPRIKLSFKNSRY